MKKSLFIFATVILVMTSSCVRTAMSVYQQPPALTTIDSYMKEVSSNHNKLAVTPFVDPSAGERYVGQTVSLAYCNTSLIKTLQKGVHQYYPASSALGLMVTLVRDDTPYKIEWMTDRVTGEEYQAKYYNWQITGTPWVVL